MMSDELMVSSVGAPRQAPRLRRSPLGLLIASAGLLCGQEQRGVRPTAALPPIVVPWESGGADNVIHSNELDDRPFPAHRIIANVYFVGTSGYSIYLITSNQGHILIDAGFESTVPKIQQSVEELGFKFEDVKILLMTHAHPDHSAGAARVKELTGAQLMVMDGDVETMVKGGRNWPSAKVDRVLHDKDQITFGGNTLTAYKTPGHTPGSTTFVWTVEDGGKLYAVNLTTSLSVNSSIALATDPDLLDQYRHTYKVLKSLPCDVFLSDHDKFFGLHDKYPRALAGGPNPYIDPEGYKAHIRLMEASMYYKMDWAIRQMVPKQ